MPWSIKTNAKGCDGFSVVKNGTNEPVPGGCHKTQGQAYKHLIALRLSYEERAQPRTPDGKFASSGGGGGSAAPASGGKYKAGDSAGSKVKSAPNNVTSKGVNPNSEYVMSGKTGNYFKNPQYNGNPAGKGKYSPNGKNKSQQGNIDDLEGGPKFKATGQAKYKTTQGSQVPAKKVAKPPVAKQAVKPKFEGEIQGDAIKKKQIDDKLISQLDDPASVHNKVNEGQKPLTGQDRKDVENYTGSGFSSANTLMRKDHGDIKVDTANGKVTKEYVDRLDPVISSRSLATDVAVSRSVNIETRKLKVGDEIYDPAFQSFSTRRRSLMGNNTVIETVLPKGTKGMSVRNVSRFKSEDEILLPAGFTAKVTSIQKIGNYGGTRITVDLVSQGVRKGSPPQPVRNLYANKQRR